MRPRAQRWSVPRQASGFTIIEMMMVVTILAILSAVAAPNMIDMVRNQRVKTASFDTFAGLVLARSEAIKRNTSVTVTPVSGGDWATGWVTKDTNGNVLSRQDPLTGVIFTGPASVTFTGMGRLSAAVDPFTLTATNLGTARARCITIDLSGRPVSKQGAGTTC